MIQAFKGLTALNKAFGQMQGVLEGHLGTPICIPNCGICCLHNSPHCMIIEAIYMVSSLIGEGRLHKVLDVAENWLLEKDPEVTIYRGLPAGILPPDLKNEWAMIYKRRCPFLTEDLSCLVHTCRPMVCQAFGVTRDAEGCPRPLGRGETSTSHAYMGSKDRLTLATIVQEFKDQCERRKPEWVIRGFIPTLLFRAAKPDKFRAYVDDNRIASAKIVGTAFDTSLMWQPQLDALRQGVTPDVVAYAYNTADPDALLAGLR